ncbi:uncharacterized protein EAE98_004155 [Botrytis deweyae]|uniref:Uncharacterized protein n=1 Tax=Botrytis deweyae TaxID=2478750 RepID=A0ABQ7ISR0_9HELO|nr:uncharacterized protein EAE98_004155 [Botrytis deweyae]KAF7932856.1 hypothetical protein EAE98_004155 [Botrytis deweyae]
MEISLITSIPNITNNQKITLLKSSKVIFDISEPLPQKLIPKPAFVKGIINKSFETTSSLSQNQSIILKSIIETSEILKSEIPESISKNTPLVSISLEKSNKKYKYIYYKTNLKRAGYCLQIIIYKWLDDNLNKGFIYKSYFRLAVLFLLAVKPGEEIFNTLYYTKIYTKLNIIITFNKLRIVEEYKWKIAFIIRFSLFKSLIISFSFCNAFVLFQNYINHVFFDFLNRNYTIYLNNILIYFINTTDY